MAAKKHLLKTALVLSALCLGACAIDLGAFEKSDGYESLYDSFGDVTGLFDGGKLDYDIQKSLFNNKTIQEFKWEKDSYAVKEKEYLYLILPMEASLKLENIALYVRSPQAIDIEISTFYFENEDAAPKKIRYLTSPESEITYDSEGNIIDEEPIEYDDPAKEESLLSGTVSLPRDTWTSFVLSNFKQPGYDDGYLHTGKNGLFYLRVENNSGWNVGELEPVSFSFINLIIRAIN